MSWLVFATALVWATAASVGGHVDVRDVSLSLAAVLVVLGVIRPLARWAAAQDAYVVCDACGTSVPEVTTAVCRDGRRRCVACPGRAA